MKDNNRGLIKEPETKYDLINWFGEEYNYTSYLEICTVGTGHYFDKIDSNIFKTKDCINYYVKEYYEVYSPDEIANIRDYNIEILPFDDYLKKIIYKKQKYDVIFIDPFHTAEHTIRDMEAACSLLSRKGVIIVHDCFPQSEDLIGPIKKGAWCGQTFEGYIRFLLKNKRMENFVINIDYGCGIIRPKYKSEIIRNFAVNPDKLGRWEYFWEHRIQLLNIEPIDNFYNLYSTQGENKRARMNRRSKNSFSIFRIKINNFYKSFSRLFGH